MNAVPPNSPTSTATAGKSSTRSGRRRAREFAVQAIYQWQIGGQDEAALQIQTEEVPGYSKADTELFKVLLNECIGHFVELRDLVQPHVSRPWNEISPIERSILLMATCELKFHVETPYRVILNEAIELTKTFGGVDGHRFVNGVLDKIAPELRPDESRQPAARAAE